MPRDNAVRTDEDFSGAGTAATVRLVAYPEEVATRLRLERGEGNGSGILHPHRALLVGAICAPQTEC